MKSRPGNQRLLGAATAAQEKLGDAVLARIVNQGLRAVVAVYDLGSNVQILGEAEVAIYSWPVFRMYGGRFFLGMDVHGNADGMQMVGHPSRSTQQHGGRRISCDVDQDCFCLRFKRLRLPGLPRFQRLCGLANGQFPQGNQNGFLKQLLVIRSSALSGG